MPQISRRRFTLLLTSAICLCARPPPAIGGLRYGQAGGRLDRLPRLLQAAFRDLDAARAVGRRFLATYPGAAADALLLSEELMADGPLTASDLRRLVARQRDRDMRRRTFVLVDGWMLARTEAQVCALTVLL